MKTAVFIFSAFAILAAGCKKNDTSSTTTPKTFATAIDTSYVAGVETPQTHNVLLEEFTGCSSTNCPIARDIIDSLQSIYGSHLIYLDINPNNIPQAQPLLGHTYDFRTITGTAIGNQIYNGIESMPEAGVDRVVYNTELQITKEKWLSAIAARISLNSGINLYLESHYNATSGYDTIAVTIAYTQAITTPRNINVAIVEDSLYDLQVGPTGEIIPNYLYNGVFRDLVTTVPTGDPILPAVANKEAGRVVKLYYAYKISTAVLYEPRHCRVIAFVTDASNGYIDVLQSSQTPFAGYSL